MRHRKSEGFTLIEVVITLAIVAILGAILVPLVARNIQSARLARAQSDASNIGKAILAFNKDMALWPVYRGASMRRLLFSDRDVDNNGAPDASEISPGWSAVPAGDRLSLYFELVDNGNARNPDVSKEGAPRWHGPYLTQMGNDPWGNPYVVNSEWLYTGGGVMRNVYVLSPGPARPANIETPFNAATPAGSDDITFRLQ